MAFSYENLKVGEDILNLVDRVYTIGEGFPSDERYALTQQMRRAATSIYLNIAEGSTRKSERDFTRFLQYCLGSIVEVHACLKIAQRRQYIDKITLDTAGQELEIIWMKVCALRSSLTAPK